MRLEWLEDILAVRETGSLTEAAQRRHLTQSAFSRRVRSIEQALGVELFDRTRKPVQLRPAIEERKDQIASLIVELRQLGADLRRIDQTSGNRVVIASQHALTASLAPVIVSELGATQQAVHVRLRSGNLDECFAMLLSRQADIVLAYRLPGEEHPITADYVDATIIGADRLVPVVATGAVGATLDQIASGEVNYIAYPNDVYFGQVMNRRILSGIGGAVLVNPLAETALTLAAIELAAAATAVAWVPASLAAERIRDGKLHDLSALLPSCALDMTAVRLTRGFGNVDANVWDCISRFRPAGID